MKDDGLTFTSDKFMKNRRWFLFSTLIILATSITLALSPVTWSRNTVSLRSLAESRGITIGAAVATNALRDDASYRELLAREFNALSSENAMKFEPLSPRRNVYDFTDADRLINFAKDHNMQVHAHVLVWHSQLPKWLTEGKFSRDELIEILKNHIQTVVGHFRGKVAAWDVVNEALTDEGTLRNTIWSQGIGPEYIAMAFRWAHEADPNVSLYYNDYNGEGLGTKSDAIYNLVKTLKVKGVPIQGVGMQMHTGVGWAPPPRDVIDNINRLGQLGLDVHISEMDVQIQKATGTESEKLTSQARIYSQIMGACLSTKACKSFTVWGLTDKHSWVPGFTGQPDAPLLFDGSYRPKPAYYALLEVLKK